MTQQLTGTVKWFCGRRGFGFIIPDDGSSDLFVHHSGIDAEGFKTLRDGERVTYTLGQSNKGPTAENVCGQR